MNLKYLQALEKYRREGYPIFSAGMETAKWETDRECGQAVFDNAGIPTLPYEVFKNYDEASLHVQKTLKRYVSKPNGDADKAMSYVSKGPEDMVFMLERWKQKAKLKESFILQEFCPGIEMAVGGWFGRNGFSKWFLENFEFKKLMNGELGVNTGEMGTAMKYCTLEESMLAQEVLVPLEAQLHRAGYTGYIDVSVIIPDDASLPPGPMEHTCRFGWPLFNIQQVLHPEIATWMKDLLEGRDTFEPLTKHAVGVLVAMPNFPFSKALNKDAEDYPVWGIDESNRYNIHPISMKLGKAPVLRGSRIVEEAMLVTTADEVLVASGVGDSVSKAAKKAYSVIDSLEIPNSPMYRLDIGQRLEKQLPKLQARGYASSWEY
jgi:phosphoribosylamine--glycine ligase